MFLPTVIYFPDLWTLSCMLTAKCGAALMVMFLSDSLLWCLHYLREEYLSKKEKWFSTYETSFSAHTEHYTSDASGHQVGFFYFPHQVILGVLQFNSVTAVST